MAKKQVYCVNLVLEKAVNQKNDIPIFPACFYMASSEDEATDTLLKEPEVVKLLKQGYQIRALMALVVPPTIAPINGTSWSVNRYAGQQLLSLKFNDFPKEAIVDLQQFADKWLDGYKL